jgi:hypothetical protein
MDIPDAGVLKHIQPSMINLPEEYRALFNPAWISLLFKIPCPSSLLSYNLRYNGGQGEQHAKYCTVLFLFLHITYSDTHTSVQKILCNRGTLTHLFH